MPVTPIRILGAGPAGLTAAITLARAGRPVEVFERRRRVGARFGGDLQALENWSDSEDVAAEFGRLGIAPDFDCIPFRSITHTNARRQVVMAFDRPAFYVVTRGPMAGTLDRALERQALAAGAAIHFGRTLPPADAHIVATGPVPGRVFAVARGIVFDTPAPDLVVCLLHEEAARRGYSYLIVAGGRGCLCSVVFQRFKEVGDSLDRARAILLAQFEVPVENAQRVGGLGHFSNEPRLQVGGSLYAGEAAGLQDFLWGFGIRTAVRSGRLAAQCLLEGRDYAREATARFGASLKASVVNRFVWEALRVGNYAIILASLKRNGLNRLRRAYGFGRIHRLLYPAARHLLRGRYPHLTI